MDIRDIKDEVVYPGKGALGHMFTLQKVLIDHYMGIEDLPKYPINLNTKPAQILIKDFAGRVIEELGEGFESYQTMLDMFHNGLDDTLLIPHLQNFNEEMSDVLHFWLELMIFSGYEWDKLKYWIEDEWGTDFDDCDLLTEYLKLGEYLSYAETNLKRFPSHMVIKDIDLKDEFLRGGRALSNDTINQMKQYLWDIVYPLQIARNTLKNKPWKQTEMMTDEVNYELYIRKATIALFKFMAFTKFTPESIYHIYYKKNKVNQFRIQSKY